MSTILDDTDLANDTGVATLDSPDGEQGVAGDPLAGGGAATAATPKRLPKDQAAEREMIRVWSNGLDWPTIGWLVRAASGRLGRAVLLYLGRL